MPFPHFLCIPFREAGSIKGGMIEVIPQRISKFLGQRQLVMAVEKPGAGHQEKLCNGILFILQ